MEQFTCLLCGTCADMNVSVGGGKTCKKTYKG